MSSKRTGERSGLLALAVLVLALVASACGEAVSPIPEPTGTPEPTDTLSPTNTPRPTDTPRPTEAPTATSTAEPTPSPGETWTRPADGMVMVYMPAGATWCGALDMADNVSELEKVLHG